VLDTLLNNAKVDIYLIGREYENEDIVWYCKFNNQGKIEYFKEVFYDNAEGNLLIESSFKQDTLTLYIDDVNDGKVREQYVLDSAYIFSAIGK
jgi:hypothetical protein